MGGKGGFQRQGTVAGLPPLFLEYVYTVTFPMLPWTRALHHTVNSYGEQLLPHHP